MGAPLVRMLFFCCSGGGQRDWVVGGEERGLLKERRGDASSPILGIEVEGVLTLKKN